MQSNVAKKLQGGQNRSAGKAFEDMVARSFEFHRKEGIAIIDKTPEPMKIIRRMQGGHFEACFEKRAQPDFKGILKGGQAIVCEVKCTTTAKLHKDVVNKWQAAYLNEAASLGAWCYVIAGFISHGIWNAYKIPWEIWSGMEEYYGHKYITEAEAEKYRVERNGFRFCLLKGGARK